MRFDFFDRNRRDLLNLKSADEFLAEEGLSPADLTWRTPETTGQTAQPRIE